MFLFIFDILKECVPSSTVNPDRWMCSNADPNKPIAHPLIFGQTICGYVYIHRYLFKLTTVME